MTAPPDHSPRHRRDAAARRLRDRRPQRRDHAAPTRRRRRTGRATRRRRAARPARAPRRRLHADAGDVVSRTPTSRRRPAWLASSRPAAPARSSPSRDGQSPAGVAAQLRAAGSSSTATLIGTDGPTAAHEVVVAYKVLATGAGRTPGRTDYQIAHVTLTRQHGAWLRLRLRDPAMTTRPLLSAVAAARSSTSTWRAARRAPPGARRRRGDRRRHAARPRSPPRSHPSSGPRPRRTRRCTAHPARRCRSSLHNARTLIAPLLLMRRALAHRPPDPPLGDLLVAALVIANATLVGLALGRYPTAAARLPAAPAARGRRARDRRRRLARTPPRRPPPARPRRASRAPRRLTLAVTIAAAIVETYAVPHKG